MSTFSLIDTGNNHRDPLDMFTDREEILDLFQQTLRSAQPSRLHLLAVKGNSGTGKTFLIDYLTRKICPSVNWQWGQLSFAESTPEFGFILDGMARALKGCVPRESLERYRAQRDEYNRRFDEYKKSVIVFIQQTMVAGGLSSISDSPQSVQINAQLHERELQLRSESRRALIELAEKSKHPLCLFIDGYEQLTKTAPELTGWLWEQVLLELAKAAPQPLVIITCGWEWPSNPVLEPFTKAKLIEFDLEQVKSYLEKQAVIASTTEPSASDQELIAAFYDLTKGYPLVLGLAVTYFQELDSHERTAENLRANIEYIDAQAAVELLDNRLLSRLQEPYRTLLERGPVLRSFDEAALKALLQVSVDSTQATAASLDDRAYIRFLRYPFINQEAGLGSNPLGIQPSFHSEVRQLRLKELRHHHAQTKEQLHCKMADYYTQIVKTERRRESGQVQLSPKSKQSTGDSRKGLLPWLSNLLGRKGLRSKPGSVKGISEAFADYKKDDAEWLAEIPEKEFIALLEWFYHALQVQELQDAAFKEWEELTNRAVNRWRRRQAGPLLELVQQLAEEGDPFLRETSNPYAHFLVWYSRFLAQEARWEEAKDKLEQAAKIFEQVGNLKYVALSLNNIGGIYQEQGKLEQALRYFERALSFSEQAGNSFYLAACLSNIGGIYQEQGKLEQALRYHKRALAYDRQLAKPPGISNSLNNIGETYREQGNLEQGLKYHEEALALRREVGNPADIAQSLNNIGLIYDSQGKSEEALRNFEQALALIKQVGDPATIATILNNIGSTYLKQGELEAALSHFEQALALKKQVDNPTEIAVALSSIGSVYHEKGEWERALNYHEQALALFEQMGNPTHIAISLNNIGLIYKDQKKWEKAIERYTRALDLLEDSGRDFEAKVAVLTGLGACYAGLGKIEEGRPYFERALQLGAFDDVIRDHPEI